MSFSLKWGVQFLYFLLKVKYFRLTKIRLVSKRRVDSSLPKTMNLTLISLAL